jgi:hypothetical protein
MLEAKCMAISTKRTTPPEAIENPSDGAIPPLENGDRLTRVEFERRYDAMPHLKKAELIEGEVFMPSPVRHGQHNYPHSLLGTLLGIYHIETPGIESLPITPSSWPSLSGRAPTESRSVRTIGGWIVRGNRAARAFAVI